MPMWVPSFLVNESEEDERDNLPLREFIYLDEVSVVSLLASLTREVTEARTKVDATETRKSWKFRIKAGLSKIPVLGSILGGKASRKTVSINKDSEEVVRKSEIESKFDELYSRTSSSFELKRKDTDSGIHASDLSQGGILEIDVEFSGHESFHYYKAFDYLIDVAEDAEYEFDPEEKQAAELMGSLFGDQIPVVGKFQNYVIVDDEIFNSAEVDDLEEAESLWIAGTLDPEMLWQDPGQFLYDDNDFTVFARVTKPEIQNDWDPIKLTRVIKSISNPIGNQLSSAIDNAFTQAKDELDNASPQEDSSESSLEGYHDEYFDLIEDDTGLSFQQDRREELLVTAYSETTISTEESAYELETTALRELLNLIEDEEGVELDREKLAEKRSSLLEGGKKDTSESGTANRKYLEVSFVAVYW